MTVFGFLIMLTFGVCTFLVGSSVSNMADLFLVCASLSFAFIGLMLWRKRTFAVFTKTSMMIIGVASILLFIAVLPTTNITNPQKNENQITKESLKPEQETSLTTSKTETTVNETVTTDSEDTQDVLIEETEATILESTPAILDRLPVGTTFIGNANSKVYHELSCEGVGHIKEQNLIFLTSVDEAHKLGLTPAGDCHPG